MEATEIAEKHCEVHVSDKDFMFFNQFFSTPIAKTLVSSNALELAEMDVLIDCSKVIVTIPISYKEQTLSLLKVIGGDYLMVLATNLITSGHIMLDIVYPDELIWQELERGDGGIYRIDDAVEVMYQNDSIDENLVHISIGTTATTDSVYSEGGKSFINEDLPYHKLV